MARKSRKPRKGRPSIHAAPMKRRNVTLDADTEAGLKSLGDGNLSGGIRVAWGKIKYQRFLIEEDKKPTTPPIPFSINKP